MSELPWMLPGALPDFNAHPSTPLPPGADSSAGPENRQDERVRVLLAGEQAAGRRQALCEALRPEEGFQVLGKARDGEEAIRLAQRLRPDVLLLSLPLPNRDEAEVLRSVVQSAGSAKCLLAAASVDKEDILRALQSGARGMVLERLLSAPRCYGVLRSVASGSYWIGDRPVRTLGEAVRALSLRKGPRMRRAFGLTPREMEIIGVVVAGYTNRAIAEKFSLSPETVKHHLSHIFDKLGIDNRLELALFAVHHRLIQEIT